MASSPASTIVSAEQRGLLEGWVGANGTPQSVALRARIVLLAAQGSSMGRSRRMVKEAGFWEHVALVLIVALIGPLANGAVALLATPFLVVLVVVAYYVVAGRAAEVERAAV